MGPVTNNPFLVAIINMTVVFGVLIVLGVLMHVIEMVDPTKKKAAPKAAAPAAAPSALPQPESTIANFGFFFMFIISPLLLILVDLSYISDIMLSIFNLNGT